MIDKIVSGGQTGVDRAALDAAVKLEIQHGGWCPRGRAAEDGKIADHYQLQCPTDNDSEEKESNIFNERTKLNIRDSDGTLILVPKVPLPSAITDGTNLTIQEVKAKKKPYLLIDLSKIQDSDLILRWIEKNNIKILNVAGPRETQSPGIYYYSLKFLENFLSRLLIAEASKTNHPTKPGCIIN
jgi:hypothetical protein